MSQSPTEAQPESGLDAYAAAWLALGRRILAGQSWSGREKHCAFLNTRDPSGAGQGRFATVSASSGIDFAEDGRALAATDWDQDGDVDLWFGNRTAPRLRFLRNGSPQSNGWLSLALRGTTSNRDGVGARVQVFATEQGQPQPPLVKTLRAGEGFLSQSSKVLHIGLGNADAVAQVTVRWPGGKSETFQGISPGNRYRLTEGKGAELLPPRPPLTLTGPLGAMPPATGVSRTFLGAPVPAPIVQYRDPTGQLQRLADAPGRPVLIVLWASWCQPCLQELSDFGKHRKELQAAGLRILALDVDALAEGGKDDPGPLVRQQAVALAQGAAEPGTLDRTGFGRLELMHRMLTRHIEPLPLPTAFLIDGEGRLAAIYRGPVPLVQLLADAAATRLPLPQRRVHAGFSPGRWLQEARPVDLQALVAAHARAELPEDAERLGRLGARLPPP